MITNPTGITQVATSRTKILGNNPDRYSVLVVNVGDYDMYVSWDTQVSTSHGVRLYAHGGAISLNADDDGELTTYEMYAVANGGATDVFVVVVEVE